MVTETIQKNDERNIALPSASPGCLAGLGQRVADLADRERPQREADEGVGEQVDRGGGRAHRRRHQLVGGRGAGPQPQRRGGDQDEEADEAARREWWP